MLVGDVARVASVMRTALVGRPMLRFDAPELIGPTPQAGRLVEVVEAKGRHLEVMWDDGIVLDTHLKGGSEWHVYRQGSPWRRSWDELRASIQTDDFVAVCFDAPSVETYRLPDPVRHPRSGKPGPDLARDDADLDEVVQLLLAVHEPDTRLRDAVVDDRVVRGVGNVHRCEVLWATGLSPWAYVSDLSVDDARQVVEVLASMVRENVERLRRTTTASTPTGLAVYGRTGQGCIRCGDTIGAQPLGRSGRMLFWCPGCQVRFDRRHPAELPVIDPHPAAAKFLSDLPWRHRDAG